uniref:DNA-binding protein RAP1 n=1 Tax=Ganoderma boninense TaxID=34458 RepID=A0A5K1JZN7_9APHY|nr:Transcriptional repressor rco-1 [Ganoderma boninense]
MPARSSSHRNEFSTREDDYLAQYIAKYNPQREGRTGNKLYQRLVENAEGKWPWHKRHTWQSWRERYRTDQARFDRRITKLLLTKSAAKPSGSGPSASPAQPPAKAKANARARASESPAPEKRERVPYTMEDDDNLAEYLAANSLSRQGRQGKNLYEAIADTIS